MSDSPPNLDSSSFEDSLRRLPEIGTPVKLRTYRQIWRLTHAGRDMYIKWFPRDGFAAKRLIRGNPAKNEFDRLVQLQKAKIHAPRALAFLSGMILNGKKGDGIATLAIGDQKDPAEPLDAILHGAKRDAKLVPNRRDLITQLITLLQSLAREGLGHSDLHLGNVLLHRGKLFLLDPSAIHPGGLTTADLSVLAHAARGHSTRSERLRVWRALTPPGSPPPREPMAESRHFWKKRVRLSTRESDSVGKIAFRDYAGVFFRAHRFPHRHSRASGLRITEQDWQRELPRLFDQLDAGLLKTLKNSASSEVYLASITLAGVPLDIIIKRPKRKHLYRYITEIGRGTRAERGWIKSWMLILRNLPAAWPLVLLERRKFGVVTDQLFITEKVDGQQLDNLELNDLAPGARERLFRKLGKILREIDETGIVHFDTKGSNFIIQPDPVLGPTPVMIDPDGVRAYTWRGEGLLRLGRSMREHQDQITPDDLAAMNAGYDFTLRNLPKISDARHPKKY